MTEEQIQRYKLDSRARGRARQIYWSEHDYERYECPDCGRRAGHSEVDGLDVHHKDGNPRNNDRENLIGLCRTCHNARHGKTYDPLTVEEWEARFAEELLRDSNSDMWFMTSPEDRTAVTDGGEQQ